MDNPAPHMHGSTCHDAWGVYVPTVSHCHWQYSDGDSQTERYEDAA